MGLSFEAAADAALDIGAYSYGRGVRRLKVRILRLQLLKLEHEPVEVVVTDERGVVDIISALMFTQAIPEFAYSFLC